MACDPVKSEPYRDRAGRSIRFRVRPLGFKAGRRVFMRTAKAVGPSLAALADRTPSLAALNLPGAIQSALQNVEDADLEWLASELEDVSAFEVDGSGNWADLTPANREALFAGNLALFFRWVWFALEVQFADFSDALRSAAAVGAPEGETRRS